MKKFVSMKNRLFKATVALAVIVPIISVGSVVYGQSTGTQGQSSEATQSIQSDTTAPTVTLLVTVSPYGSTTFVDGSTFSTSPTPRFSLTASDSGSGVASKQIYIDSQPYNPSQPAPPGFSYSVGTHVIDYVVTDYAGNTASKRQYFNIQ